MRTIAIAILTLATACTTGPAPDPCDHYSIELAGSPGMRVGDTRAITVTDFDTATPPSFVAKDLEMPSTGIVMVGETNVVAVSQGNTMLEVAVGACRAALPIHVDAP